MTYLALAIVSLAIGILFFEVRDLHRKCREHGALLEASRIERSRDLREFDEVKLQELRAVIEQQDALIAVLWHRVIGARVSDDLHSDGVTESACFGVSVPWSLDTRWYEDDQNRFHSLKRDMPYPWGSHAEGLHS